MKASVATAMRDELGCDEDNFSSPEECCLQPNLPHHAL